MKILTIAATPFFSDRGCHIRIYNEAKYLKKFGADVKICAYHIGDDVEGLNVVRIKGPKWYKKTIPGFHWGKLWLDLKLLCLCRREIKTFGPDIIHAHLWEGLAIGYLAKKLARRKNIPLVFDLQGDLKEELHSYNKKNRLTRRFFVWLAGIINDWADYTVVSSENSLKNISESLQNKARFAVIRDGVDLELYDKVSEPKGDEAEKIEKLKKWKGERKLLMYIGGLSDNKGVKELLDAFADFTRGSEKWKLALLGYGTEEEKYQDFIKEKNLEKLVCLPGRVNYFSLPHYLASADAVIDPKKESAESSGKLMGYMAVNLPIICFENDFNWLRLGDNGFYLKLMSDLGGILNEVDNTEVVTYNLESLSEEKEARRLFEIFQSLAEKSLLR